MEKEQEITEFLDRAEKFLIPLIAKKVVSDLINRQNNVEKNIYPTPHNKTQSPDVIEEDWGDQPF